MTDLPAGTNITELNAIDPMQFRVPGSDTKGHASRVYFRCQPGHSHQIDMLVQSKQFPYRTKGDLLRHSLVRHLRWLEGLGQWRVPSVLAEVDAIIELIRDDEFAQEFSAVFDKLGERISNHLGQGSAGEARRLLLSITKHVERMPEGYWRDRYTKEIEQRYGHIVTNAPKASLRYIRDK